MFELGMFWTLSWSLQYVAQLNSRLDEMFFDLVQMVDHQVFYMCPLLSLLFTVLENNLCSIPYAQYQINLSCATIKRFSIFSKTVLECREHLYNIRHGMQLSKLIDWFQGQLKAIVHHFYLVWTKLQLVLDSIFQSTASDMNRIAWRSMGKSEFNRFLIFDIQTFGNPPNSTLKTLKDFKTNDFSQWNQRIRYGKSIRKRFNPYPGFLGPSPNVFSGKKKQIRYWWCHRDLENKNYMYR